MSQIRSTWCDSWTKNATWCTRGPAPPVNATSCTVCLRNIHAAYSVSSSSIVSDRPKPSEV
jgi:hypothetical protein